MSKRYLDKVKSYDPKSEFHSIDFMYSKSSDTLDKKYIITIMEVYRYDTKYNFITYRGTLAKNSIIISTNIEPEELRYKISLISYNKIYSKYRNKNIEYFMDLLKD